MLNYILNLFKSRRPIINPGILKDPLDKRDAVAAAFIKPVELPKSHIGYLVSNPMAQHYHPFCGSFTGQRMAMERDYKETGKEIVLSPNFLYAVSHTILPNGHKGYGMYTREVVKVLSKYGIPLFEDYPFDWNKSTEKLMKQPSEVVMKKALMRKGKDYARVITTIEDIKQSHYQNGSVALALYISGYSWNYLGDIRVPREGQDKDVGHLVSVVGWDDDLEVLYIQDSLVPKRNGKNYSPMPYGYLTHFMDSWTYMDLPNNWQEINNNYKEETMVTRNNANGMLFALSGKTDNDPDAQNLANALNIGDQDGVNAILAKYGPNSASLEEFKNKLKEFINDN